MNWRVQVQYKTSQHHEQPLTHTVAQPGAHPFTALAAALRRLERQGAGRIEDVTDIRMEPR